MQRLRSSKILKTCLSAWRAEGDVHMVSIPLASIWHFSKILAPKLSENAAERFWRALTVLSFLRSLQLLASVWHFCSHSGCQRRPQSHLWGFTWVGININRPMKVIANVLIRYDDNIDSKRMNGKKLSNLTNRWWADSKEWSWKRPDSNTVSKIC